MKAINGPYINKNYIVPKETNKVIDRYIGLGFVETITYYRTKNGWSLYSLKQEDMTI